MSYEVDVLSVGKASKSGDAIALRHGNFSRRDLHKVVIIDGGFTESGEDLVKIIQGTYNTSVVDLVISTHPDSDHSSGLKVVLESLKVCELWMHQPWNHAKEATAYRGASSGRFSQRITESLATASDLESIAQRKGIPIREPFNGLQLGDGQIVVLGPDETYYNELIAQFEEPSRAVQRSLVELARQMVREAARKFRELWDNEVLIEPEIDATSPQNNSSAIVLAGLDDDWFLFTSDAGVPALDRAIPSWRAEHLRGRLRYVQIPHHGSKRNVSPAILDRILGPRVARGATTGITAFVSAAKDGEPKHPSKRVTNSAIRRGAGVIATQGVNHLYRSRDIPLRSGYGPITPIDFCETYEDED